MSNPYLLTTYQPLLRLHLCWKRLLNVTWRCECAWPTCSVSRRVRRKKPSRQPMTTASTDSMRSPFCLHTFFTRSHTASRATAMFTLRSGYHQPMKRIRSPNHGSQEPGAPIGCGDKVRVGRLGGGNGARRRRRQGRENNRNLAWDVPLTSTFKALWDQAKHQPYVHGNLQSELRRSAYFPRISLHPSLQHHHHHHHPPPLPSSQQPALPPSCPIPLPIRAPAVPSLGTRGLWQLWWFSSNPVRVLL